MKIKLLKRTGGEIFFTMDNATPEENLRGGIIRQAIFDYIEAISELHTKGIWNNQRSHIDKINKYKAWCKEFQLFFGEDGMCEKYGMTKYFCNDVKRLTTGYLIDYFGADIEPLVKESLKKNPNWDKVIKRAEKKETNPSG